MIKRFKMKTLFVENCPKCNEGESRNCFTCLDFYGIANDMEIKCNYLNHS